MKNKIESAFLEYAFQNSQTEKEAKLVGAICSEDLIFFQKVRKQCEAKFTWEALRAAIQSGLYDLFLYTYKDSKLMIDHLLLREAALSKNIDIFRHVLEISHAVIDRSILAASTGNLDIFRLALSKSIRPIDIKILCNSAETGSLEIFFFALEKSHLTVNKNVVMSAARSGNIKLFERILELSGSKIDDNILLSAMLSHNLEIFLYVLKEIPNSIPASYLTLAFGNLEIYSIALENLKKGDIIDECCLINAARSGQKEIFALTLANKDASVKVSHSVLCAAAETGDMAIFSLALEKVSNVEVDGYVIADAAKSGNFLFFQQLLQKYNVIFEKGHWISNQLLLNATIGGNLEIFSYALNYSTCCHQILRNAAITYDPLIFRTAYEISGNRSDFYFESYYKSLGKKLKTILAPSQK